MIERKNVTYECEICGNLFDNKQECEECEESHIVDFSDRPNDELIRNLNLLGNSAYSYRIGEMVMGLPINSFKSLMSEAAKRLGDKE